MQAFVMSGYMLLYFTFIERYCIFQLLVRSHDRRGSFYLQYVSPLQNTPTCGGIHEHMSYSGKSTKPFPNFSSIHDIPMDGNNFFVNIHTRDAHIFHEEIIWWNDCHICGGIPNLHRRCKHILHEPHSPYK